MHKWRNLYYRRDGFTEEGGWKRVPFLLIISKIQQEDSAQAPYCVVECALQQDSPYQVHGPTESQICETVCSRISTILEHKGMTLYDEEGSKVDLPLVESGPRVLIRYPKAGG